MLTNEEKETYFTKVNKQIQNGLLLQTRVLTCSENCQKLKMNFKLAFKNDIISSHIKQIN
ncbi:MAG: hypothetical protein CXT73_07475 [Methanobacteriota archaeon]|jgi:hypothetical protein|nr:MAG: hypothetical protein CXT73_07475 [Euryarchaeota archaeon]